MGFFPSDLSRSLKIVPSDPRDEISVVFILSRKFDVGIHIVDLEF